MPRRSPGDGVESHPARQAIRARLLRAPRPIPVDQLAQLVGLSLAQTDFHVRVLVACDLAAFEEGGVVATE